MLPSILASQQTNYFLGLVMFFWGVVWRLTLLVITTGLLENKIWNLLWQFGMSLEWHNIDETFVHIHWPSFKFKFKHDHVTSQLDQVAHRHQETREFNLELNCFIKPTQTTPLSNARLSINCEFYSKMKYFLDTILSPIQNK